MARQLYSASWDRHGRTLAALEARVLGGPDADVVALGRGSENPPRRCCCGGIWPRHNNAIGYVVIELP